MAVASDDAPDAVLLLGPTASGKSAVAMAVARRRPVEIVSVDSAQVFRGMDIGTAKPGADERRAVPHHLIDLIEPTEVYSAARFADDARVLIDAIRARGALPLLVGGTMLYARALAQGLDTLPGADPAIRLEIEAQARADGWPALHARLAALDAATAARLEPNDAQRIQRALEVIRLTGRPLSAQRGASAGTRSPPRLLTIALEPSDRAVLHERIATRFRAMVAGGLLDEVRRLRARGDLHEGLPSMRCVGYRQAWVHLDALDTGTGSHEDFVARGIAATRQLAKRQLTWLRSMPARQVVDALDARAADRVSAIIDDHER